MASIPISVQNRSAPSAHVRDNRATPIDRKILCSWKEIAAYMGLGVRTIQRYERAYRLPIRRPAQKDRSAVMAFSDEVDAWLAKVPTRPLGYVRPVLVIFESPDAGTSSKRKIALEDAYFNVLTALSIDEAYATAEKFDVDGFVFDCGRDDEISVEMCESLKARFPKKPLFVVVPASRINGNSPKGDYVIPAGDLRSLVSAVLSVLGLPRIE